MNKLQKFNLNHMKWQFTHEKTQYNSGKVCMFFLSYFDQWNNFPFKKKTYLFDLETYTSEARIYFRSNLFLSHYFPFSTPIYS